MMRFLRIHLQAVFTILMLLMLSNVPAAESSVEYTIKKGDNLASIAKRYKVNAKDIQRENNISPRNMKPGTKIMVPVRTAATGKKKGPAVAHEKTVANAGKKQKGSVPVETASAAPSTPDTFYHTIRKGDTLATIARKYSISTAELKELNNLKSKKRLKPGRKLLVKRIGPKTYIVKKGDTMQKLAKKFDMDSDDLMELNEMETPQLKVGQKLYLEEKLDSTSAETYSQAFSRNIEEEIKKVSESEEFAAKDSPDKLTTFAKKLLNIPYKFGGNSILGIDCSAYVKKVYGLMGVELPRTAREQFHTGEAIDKDELSIGDLVFFRTYASFPSHVGIYLGNNLFIHASSKGKRVTIDSLETPYYVKRFIGGKRLLTESQQEKDPQG